MVCVKGMSIPILPLEDATRTMGNMSSMECCDCVMQQTRGQHFSLSALVPNILTNKSPVPEQMVEQPTGGSFIQGVPLIAQENRLTQFNSVDTQRSDAGTQHEKAEEKYVMRGHNKLQLTEEDIVRFQRKIRARARRQERKKETVILPTYEDPGAFFEPLFGNEYTEAATGSRIIRQSGGKDRHSKVFTSKGPRDRRVRLSVSTAIQFYDVQDRLGFDQPSKAVEWLIKKAKSAIDELAQLPNLSLKRLKTAEYQINRHPEMSTRRSGALSGTDPISSLNSNVCLHSMEKSSMGGATLTDVSTEAFLSANKQAYERQTNLDCVVSPDQIPQELNIGRWNQLKRWEGNQISPSSLLEKEKNKETAKDGICDIRVSSGSSVDVQCIPHACFYGNSSVAKKCPKIDPNQKNLNSDAAKQTATVSFSVPSSLQRFSDYSILHMAANPSHDWVQDQLLQKPSNRSTSLDALAVESSQKQLPANSKIQDKSLLPKTDINSQVLARGQNDYFCLKPINTLLPPKNCDFGDTPNSKRISWSEVIKPSPIYQGYLYNSAIRRMSNSQNAAGQEEGDLSFKNSTRPYYSVLAEMPQISVSSYTTTCSSNTASLYNAHTPLVPMEYGSVDDDSFMLYIQEGNHELESLEEKPRGKVL